jgi:hypothetical protein
MIVKIGSEDVADAFKVSYSCIRKIKDPIHVVLHGLNKSYQNFIYIFPSFIASSTRHSSLLIFHTLLHSWASHEALIPSVVVRVVFSS